MKLVLGTANLGLAYGKAKSRCLPTKKLAFSILERAIDRGFSAIDTAPAYGSSEARIGEYLSRCATGTMGACISTKTHPSLHLEPYGKAQPVLEGFSQSLQALGLDAISQVLLHRWEQYEAADGKIWNALKTLKEEGLIDRIGASVQSPDELEAALGCADIDTIQLACNILDWRYEARALDVRMAQSDKRIEVRSVFLQGLLGLSPSVKFPKISDAYDELEIRNFLVEAAAKFTNGDVIALCLRYAASLHWADALVIGADSPGEIDTLSDILDTGPLTADVISELPALRPHVPASFLDPAQWQ